MRLVVRVVHVGLGDDEEELLHVVLVTCWFVVSVDTVEVGDDFALHGALEQDARGDDVRPALGVRLVLEGIP